MAHITVIKADKAIYENSVAIIGCDITGLPDDFHALQWNGSEGHIEFTNEKPNLSISSESEIESELGVSLTTLLQRRTAKKAELDANE